MKEINEKSIFYPPAGILIWIVIYLELLTFGMALLGLAYYGSIERNVYHTDSLLLNKNIATINTVLLLTGGYFAVNALNSFKKNLFDESVKLMNLTILSGLGFVALKLLEYYQKIDAGLGIDYSSFFMNYWLLTAFHLLHVLVGIVILYFLKISIKKNKEKTSLEDLEAGITFWHMCDLIWLLIFPLLYLVF